MADISKHDPFRSFWMGGFEGAYHLNGRGAPLDTIASNGHDLHFEADNAAAAALGIPSLRKSLGLRFCGPAAQRHEFARAEATADAARRQAVQLLWTLMHYGTPPEISLHHDELIPLFASFAAEGARWNLQRIGAGLGADQRNRFVAWAASETHMMMPYAAIVSLPGKAVDGHPDSGSSLRSGYRFKRRLVRAALGAMHAIAKVGRRARFVHVESVVHMVGPREEPALQATARIISAYQWQFLDLLSGRTEPALGGSAHMLDLVGVNYNHSGQSEVGTERRLSWSWVDTRWRDFAHLLAEVWHRYGRPLTIVGTSHVGEGRGPWLNEIADQVARARAEGVPVNGLCLYPLTDRPDWNNAARWHRRGLFEVLPERPRWQRSLHPSNAAALVRCQTYLPSLSLQRLPPCPR